MKESILAKRYAEAFVDHARDAIGLERLVDEMKGIKRMVCDSQDFRHFLEDPEIAYAERRESLENILKERFSEELINFIKLLLDKRRISLLVPIADYIRIKYSHGGAMSALLKTSYPLGLELIQRIKDKLERKFNKKLNLYLELDGTLMGGVQVVVGNTVIDGSVRRRLEDLRGKFKAVKTML